MSQLKELLDQEAHRIDVDPDALESMLRRRDRNRRNQRVAAAFLAIIIALVSFAAVMRTFGAVEDRPADEPTPAPSPAGIFADVGGWIAYGNDRVQEGPLGIWAVDPTRPNDTAPIQLSERPGDPLAWSSDGSKLLILRTWDRPGGTPGCPGCSGPSWVTLIVLNADGTETQVVTNNPKAGGGRLDSIVGGSFSPDGSQIVFATFEVSPSYADRVDGIYTVDADGGTPRLILAAGPRLDVVGPTFSPDGTQIAYTELTTARPVDEGFSLRVVNADGTGVRVLHEAHPSMQGGAAWSPDGTHIAFGWDRSIWVIRSDGSGIAKVSDGYGASWSPDGSRIAFDLPHGGPLAIVDLDGTHLQEFGNGIHAGPWNPLISAARGGPSSTVTTGGKVSPFVYAIVALGVVGVLFLAWRARRRTAAT